MRIRLRRGELAIIAVTLMFACFIGGYFTGRRGAVNIIQAAPPSYEGPAVAQNSSQGTGGSGAESAAPATGGASATNEAPAGSGEGQNGQDDSGEIAAPTGEASALPGSLRDDDGKININSASRSELMDLSGIGQVLAERIVNYRTQNGPFTSIDDLKKVSGIGDKRFEAIKDRITVG